MSYDFYLRKQLKDLLAVAVENDIVRRPEKLFVNVWKHGISVTLNYQINNGARSHVENGETRILV